MQQFPPCRPASSASPKASSPKALAAAGLNIAGFNSGIALGSLIGGSVIGAFGLTAIAIVGAGAAIAGDRRVDASERERRLIAFGAPFPAPHCSRLPGRVAPELGEEIAERTDPLRHGSTFGCCLRKAAVAAAT